jgi:starch synthase
VRVVHVASEVAPFAQSGGLADVLAGLPAALADRGVDCGVVVPLYRRVPAKLEAAGIELAPGVPMSIAIGPHVFEVAIRVARVGRVRYGFVDCAALYDRDGLYGPGGTAEYPDNHLRFALLGKAALASGDALFGAPLSSADVVNAHDWQGAPAAIYARLEDHPAAIVTTIHNLAFRGVFGKHVMDELGLPWTIFTSHRAEFYDQLSFLKGGLAASDAVTTVSPSYAREIVTPEHGEGLSGFLLSDVSRLVGIVNGIDVDTWNPATDPALAAAYSADKLAGKKRCRKALVDELGLPIRDHEPLIGVIARMSWQKGLDLVADLVPELYGLGARMVVLGAGDPDLEARFRYLGNMFRDHVAVRIGFDGALARRIYAGCDLFAMPSRFEPCGLGQLYAMRYGTLPVVHAVGGLRDTVVDAAETGGTGFRFDIANAFALGDALERAIRVCRNRDALTRLRVAAMTRDSSWSASAEQYVGLYTSLRHK